MPVRKIKRVLTFDAQIRDRGIYPRLAVKKAVRTSSQAAAAIPS